MEDTNEESHNIDHNRTYASVVSHNNDTSNNMSNNNPSFIHITNANDSENKDLRNFYMENEFPKQSFEDLSHTSSVVLSEYSGNTDDNDQSTVFTISNGSINPETAAAERSSVTLAMTESNLSAETTDSIEDLDMEDEENSLEDSLNALKRRFIDLDNIPNLPETVTVLETNHGSKVFLVGTAHFSEESQEDVAKVIQAVQPDCVIIELCKSRLNVLCLDEATILEEAKDLNFQKIKQTIELNGVLQGTVCLLLLSMCAHLTKQLGMAPGGEFRRAYNEARRVPGCVVQLGDRPIHITLQRALAKLSWWQKIRVAYHILKSKGPISKEDVERCKQKDLLEEMLADMTGEFPELSEVLVKERDIYLAYSIQMAATPVLNASSVPTCVVGVVGIGHLPGIKEQWGKVKDEDIPPILCIPEPSLSSRIIRQSIKLSFFGLGLYGAYKLMPSRLKLCFSSFKLF